MDIKQIKDTKTAIHCASLAEVGSLFKLLPDAGYKPMYPASYYWEKHREKLCFGFINRFSFATKRYYDKTLGYQILPANDFIT